MLQYSWLLKHAQYSFRHRLLRHVQQVKVSRWLAVLVVLAAVRDSEDVGAGELSSSARIGDVEPSAAVKEEGYGGGARRRDDLLCG